MKPADAAGGSPLPQSPAAQRSTQRPRKSTTPPNIGRPSLYTPEMVETIVTALAGGNTKRDAALGAGITYTTMREWEVRFPEFAIATEKAQAQARQKMVAIVVKVAESFEGNWQAAMTFLERRDPEHWGRKDRVSLSVDLNREARRLAQETGLDEAAILAEAEALLRNG
jgi:hypothetical protein